MLLLLEPFLGVAGSDVMGLEALKAVKTSESGTSFGVDHRSLKIVKELGHVQGRGSMIPLPKSFFFEIVEERDDEPEFDPEIHLDLRMPEHVTKLDDFSPSPPDSIPRVNSSEGSKLAFTAPFSLFSEEGVKVIHSIVMREKHKANRNHRNVELRGLYYTSPFVRQMMTNPTLLGFLEEFAGEPIWPHFILQDSPSVNFGKATRDTVIQGVVDPWHFDSVAYVGVALISDIEGMVGGELQIVKKRKEEALRLIERTNNNVTGDDLLTVSYEKPGWCIFVQGSEMVHRVTRVQKAKEPRLSFIMAFQPSNPFQPDKTVLDTWMRFDAEIGSAPFEFFRTKAHTMGSALHHLAAEEEATTDRVHLSNRLRAVAAELSRTADLLEGKDSDFIGFVNETIYASECKLSDGQRKCSA